MFEVDRIFTFLAVLYFYILNFVKVVNIELIIYK